jgi:sulfur carrier protein
LSVMILKVNGEEYTTERDTLARLLRELEIIPERVAVEVNLMVIRKNDFEHYRLKDGDSVEIVYFVGGGQHGREDERRIDY